MGCARSLARQTSGLVEIMTEIGKGQKLTKVAPPDETAPRIALRADRLPTEGFAMVVDAHFKSIFDTTEAAESAGTRLKSAYPMLQIEIYDAVNRKRSLLS